MKSVHNLAAPSVENVIAQNMQLLVREAFAWAALQGEYREEGTWSVVAGVAHAVRSSWPDDNRWMRLGPDPYRVMVFTECCPPRGAAYVLRDPFRDSRDYDLWNQAVARLEQSPWIAEAGWESINQAVHYVWITPRIVS